MDKELEDACQEAYRRALLADPARYRVLRTTPLLV